MQIKQNQFQIMSLHIIHTVKLYAHAWEHIRTITLSNPHILAKTSRFTLWQLTTKFVDRSAVAYSRWGHGTAALLFAYNFCWNSAQVHCQRQLDKLTAESNIRRRETYNIRLCLRLRVIQHFHVFTGQCYRRQIHVISTDTSSSFSRSKYHSLSRKMCRSSLSLFDSAASLLIKNYTVHSFLFFLHFSLFFW